MTKFRRRTRTGPTMVRRIVAVVAAVLLLGSATVVAASPAAAYSSSARTAQYWYPHNGCSSPFGDAPSGRSFTDACNQHDGCYWGRWASKWTCDSWFYDNMRNACGWNAWCQAWAYAYYRSVDAFGWPYYACRCDPSPPNWFRP